MKDDIFFKQQKDIGNDKLYGKFKLDWVENFVELNSAGEDSKIFSRVSSHVGTSFSAKKAYVILFFSIFLFVLLISRLTYLQIIRGDFYRNRAENNRQRIIPISSERGIIYDSQMNPLTKNIPSFSLAIIPQDLPKEKEEMNKIITRLANIIDKEEEEIKKIIEEYKNYRFESIVVKENIDYNTAIKIKIYSSELPGVYVYQGSKRLYLPTENKNQSFSHILGYIGKLNQEELNNYYRRGYLPSDSIGKTGVEKSYESYLRGSYGKKIIEVNAFGKQQSIISQENPKPGTHIKLSIDSEIQNNFEKIIREGIKKIHKTRATGIVLDPRNGEILALVSIPGFNNNDFSGGITSDNYKKYIDDEDIPLFNRAIGGTYPSGSTLKPAIASAALQEGIINEKTSFNSVGGLWVSSWFFPDWLAGGHGITDVRRSLAWSVNTFYYYIGGGYGDFKGLGVEKIGEYLKKFGFGSKLGIDLPGEHGGIVPDPIWKKEVLNEDWYVGDTYNLSIGQGGFLTTPLQIASLTATIANGGTLYKPKVVHSIIDPNTQNEMEFEPEIINSNFISQLNNSIVRQGMRDCVTYGACRRMLSLPFTSAGKTGTAQWNNNNENHAWYSSFAPYENPEIVVILLIEEGGWGSAECVPIVYDFYNWWYSYKNS